MVKLNLIVVTRCRKKMLGIIDWVQMVSVFLLKLMVYWEAQESNPSIVAFADRPVVPTVKNA